MIERTSGVLFFAGAWNRSAGLTCTLYQTLGESQGLRKRTGSDCDGQVDVRVLRGVRGVAPDVSAVADVQGTPIVNVKIGHVISLDNVIPDGPDVTRHMKLAKATIRIARGKRLETVNTVWTAFGAASP